MEHLGAFPKSLLTSTAKMCVCVRVCVAKLSSVQRACAILYYYLWHKQQDFQESASRVDRGY